MTTFGVEVDQRHINFIQWLEKEYKVDIKTSADYVEIRNIWISEGSSMPKPKNVAQNASQGVREPLYKPLPKGLPMRWDDLLKD